MEPIVDTSASGIRQAAEFYAGSIGRLKEMVAAGSVTDGRIFAEDGLRCAVRGLRPLARDYFLAAIPLLKKELRSDHPDIEFEIRGKDGSSEDAQAAKHAGAELIGASAVIPFDARTRSESWTCAALCRWFLNNEHDAGSYTQASEELHRYFQTHPKELRDRGWMDQQGRTFCLGGDDERLLAYFSSVHTHLKPLRRPSQAKTERAMALVLAMHRRQGQWSTQQVEQAWQAFLSAQVPEMLEHGGIVALASWLKARHWDDAVPKPDPFEALMRAYQFLPGTVQPPLEE